MTTTDPYRSCPHPYPHIHTPMRQRKGWTEPVLAGLLLASAAVNITVILAWPRELGHWSERTELNASGDMDLVIRGPHGREVFRMSEPPPPTPPVVVTPSGTGAYTWR